jgi:hypothetical protein
MQYNQAANYTLDNKSTVAKPSPRGDGRDVIEVEPRDAAGQMLFTPNNPGIIKPRKAVATGSYDQTLNVGSNEGVTITIAPAAGELWRVKMLRVIFPAPVGATFGTHYFDVSFGITGSGYSFMRLDSNYNNAISIYNNVAIADVATPFDELTQFLAINSLVATDVQPLRFYYRNSTDATQTGNLTLRIAREVEYIA